MIDWRDRISIIGAVIISVFVLSAFSAVCTALFFHEIPPSSHDIAIGLFGSLGTMSTGVVYFWTGSTSSSQKKDATLADTAKAAAQVASGNGTGNGTPAMSATINAQVSTPGTPNKKAKP